MKIVLFGAPGCGKGSQARKISEKYNLPIISTGDLFRFHISNNTPIGIEAKKYINLGNLVPDEITIKIVEERLKQADCQNGFILDGFPRNIFQAKALDQITKIDLFLFIDVSISEIEIRAVNRRICPKCNKIFSMLDVYRSNCDNCNSTLIQRDDDKIEVVRNRIKNYQATCDDVIEFYKSKKVLQQILSAESADATFLGVDEVIKNYLKKKAKK